ncbi:hypothetical protein [Pseudonocardia humida]|uniref:Uncharacterized protein n=1 Tax=Pseudonocardia humida TaxID=2800819 RepID=A0ABT1A076_9PSEU|nr:hypothetical protein [Pseudonocardia humida]MCO1656343.1 hypothetical protein [Pseudonocardia humida]
MNEWLTELVSWAWGRHHNILSWYIRPLFLLPFCFFAWRRSWAGTIGTVVALMSSIAWFPTPSTPDPAVIEMLRVEQEYLLGEWTIWKVAAALLIPLLFVGLGAALWRRSLGWGLVVINAGVLFKVVWTFVVGGGEGALAHLPTALIGLAVVDAVLIGVGHWLKRRAATSAARADAPAPAEVR